MHPGKDGKEITRTGIISDVDDIFYYGAKREVFVSGGGGAINILRNDTISSFKTIASIPTRSGARTSLLIPSLQMYILAEREGGGHPAAIAVYKIEQ